MTTQQSSHFLGVVAPGDFLEGYFGTSGYRFANRTQAQHGNRSKTTRTSRSIPQRITWFSETDSMSDQMPTFQLSSPTAGARIGDPHTWIELDRRNDEFARSKLLVKKFRGETLTFAERRLLIRLTRVSNARMSQELRDAADQAETLLRNLRK